MHIVFEGFLLLGGVAVGVLHVAVAYVVGDVVVGREAVGGADAVVDERGHLLVEVACREVGEGLQLVAFERLAELDVYSSLGLSYAGEDAVEVFAGLLDVGSALFLIEFDGLEDVAGLPLVGDGHGHYVQLVERLDLVVGAAHAEHLYDALVCAVDAVLGASVALCYPDGLSLLGDGVAYVAREVER